MLVYLDNSALNRPFDDLSQAQLRIEAELCVLVVEWIEKKKLQLAISEVLLFEHNRNPFPERKEKIEAVLSLATKRVSLTPSLQRRARALAKKNLHPLDALHLASAEAAEAEFFITCDYGILKKWRQLSLYRLRVVNPIGFGKEVLFGERD